MKSTRATKSWHEIKQRAVAFIREWENETSEHAESQTFWNEFFAMFGVVRRRVALFNKHVKDIKRTKSGAGFIDLFWKGVLIVEHKSGGKKLTKADSQAIDYLEGIHDKDLPKFILSTDFKNFHLQDLENAKSWFFPLHDLSDNIRLFGFMIGQQTKVFKDLPSADIKAAEMMGKLHDQLKLLGYNGHPLEMLLVRLLYCMFAENTEIFDRRAFTDYVHESNDDGTGLGGMLCDLFNVLNTEIDKRSTALNNLLTNMAYINGGLFSKAYQPASFDGAARSLLLQCCEIDWKDISPSIFGSLFQSVMNPELRREIGAHYTSEKNIRKVIEPLFMDKLNEDFKNCGVNQTRLRLFHQRISALKFFDPACGCGNFLVVTYRELRLLEIKVIKSLYKDQQMFDIENVLKVNVDQFYGIEHEDFAVQVAKVAMWLTDHQMNLLVSREFGESYSRLPLIKSANIKVGNATRQDWGKLVQQADYIFGNPPFVGSTKLNAQQKSDMEMVFGKVKGEFDYVTAWYKLACEYMQSSSKTKCAFVSTNSITQGEQPAPLWCHLYAYGINIDFAHRTFKWHNDGRHNAAVHVVIIGFSKTGTKNKQLFSYEKLDGDPTVTVVDNITPYLTVGKTVLVFPRRTPLCNVAVMKSGSKPTDGGHLLLTDDEKEDLVAREPQADKYIRPYLGTDEFISGVKRWCLWLVNAKPSDLKMMPHVTKRIAGVAAMRMASTKKQTRDLGRTPTLFEYNAHADTESIIVPATSSSERMYVPVGFLPKDHIVSNAAFLIPDADLYHFGVLSSSMHIAWVRTLAGRMKSDFRYSVIVVYNTFPWGEPTKKAKDKVVAAAQRVIDARKQHGATLDVLYGLLMPQDLLKAHQALDNAVDECYRQQPFKDDDERLNFLFARYAALVS